MNKKVDYLIAFFVILGLNFFLPRLLPVEPLSAIYGDEALMNMNDEMKAELLSKMGLDQPLFDQFLMYLKGLFKLELGYSYHHREEVVDVIASSLPWTLLLVGLGIILSTILSSILGIGSAYKYKGSYDKCLLTINLMISGLPQFFIGIILLMIFSVMHDVFPISGAYTIGGNLEGIEYVRDVLYHLALPLMAVVVSETSRKYFIVRNTAITILKRPFMMVGKAKSLREKTLKYRYIGRNSFFPLLASTAISAGKMIAGTLLIEIVFSYPGIGSLVYNAISLRDYPLVQGIFLLVAVAVLMFNYLAEAVIDSYSKL